MSRWEAKTIRAFRGLMRASVSLQQALWLETVLHVAILHVTFSCRFFVRSSLLLLRLRSRCESRDIACTLARLGMATARWWLLRRVNLRLTKDLLYDSLLVSLSYFQISQLAEALDKIGSMERCDLFECLWMGKLYMTVRQLKSSTEASLNLLLLSGRFTYISFVGRDAYCWVLSHREQVNIVSHRLQPCWGVSWSVLISTRHPDIFVLLPNICNLVKSLLRRLYSALFGHYRLLHQIIWPGHFYRINSQNS